MTVHASSKYFAYRTHIAIPPQGIENHDPAHGYSLFTNIEWVITLFGLLREREPLIYIYYTNIFYRIQSLNINSMIAAGYCIGKARPERHFLSVHGLQPARRAGII
jgi:hypothetical protein